jgi:hypothetical protein
MELQSVFQPSIRRHIHPMTAKVGVMIRLVYGAARQLRQLDFVLRRYLRVLVDEIKIEVTRLQVTTPQSEADDALGLIVTDFDDQPVIDALDYTPWRRHTSRRRII